MNAPKKRTNKTIFQKLLTFQNEIFVFLVTSILFLLFSLFNNINESSQNLILMQDNHNLMIKNLNLKALNDGQKDLIYKQQQYLIELEKFRDAMLKGNYTQNEKTKQREFEVVGFAEK